MKHKLFDTSFYMAKNGIPYTLVIIDVQHGYSAAENEPLLDNILKEIKIAKQNDAAILFVNMVSGHGIGRNIGCIWDAAYDYTYFAQVVKKDTDGSDEIIQAFRKYRFLNKTNLKVGGVYSDVCVTDTVNGLTKKLPKTNVEVLTKCCYADVPSMELDIDMYEDDGDTYDYFGAIKPRKNVQLIF